MSFSVKVYISESKTLIQTSKRKAIALVPEKSSLGIKEVKERNNVECKMLLQRWPPNNLKKLCYV